MEKSQAKINSELLDEVKSSKERIKKLEVQVDKLLNQIKTVNNDLQNTRRELIRFSQKR